MKQKQRRNRRKKQAEVAVEAIEAEPVVVAAPAEELGNVRRRFFRTLFKTWMLAMIAGMEKFQKYLGYRDPNDLS